MKKRRDVLKGRMIPLKQLVLNSGIQPRETLSEDTIERYAESYREGVKFPDLVAYEIDGRLYLTEGFHRWHGAKRAGLAEINVTIVRADGLTLDDALLTASASNVKHGLPRSFRDMRLVVNRLLGHPVFGGWSVRRIARAASVSTGLVSNVMRERGESRGNPIRPRVVARDVATGFAPRDAEVDESTSADLPPGRPLPKPSPTLRDFAKHLESGGQSVRIHVKTEVGIIHILTDDAMYHVEERLDPAKLTFAVGSLMLHRKLGNDSKKMVVVSFDSEKMPKLVGMAIQLGIEFRAWDGRGR